MCFLVKVWDLYIIKALDPRLTFLGVLVLRCLLGVEGIGRG